MLTVQDNNVWVSSNKGISRVNLTDNSIIHYGKDNGISEEEFSEICGVKRHNGELVFGSRRGILVFRGNEIVKNERKPKVFLNHLVERIMSMASETHLGPKLRISFKEFYFIINHMDSYP